MDIMTDTEAREIIEQLGGAAIADIVSLAQRIEELKADYAADPWEDTAKQITRLEERMEKREREAAALFVADSKFPKPMPTRETHDFNKAWRFLCESYQDSNYSPSKADWSDEDVFGFVADHHIDGLDAFKKESK